MAIEPDRKWFIYALKDPKTGEIRYVGWTVDIESRLKAHLAQSRSGLNTHVGKWIRSLDNQGLVFDHEILETGCGDGWSEAERKWIATFRNRGVRLTNLTDGGSGNPGYRPSLETREKMSRAQMGRKQTPESIAKTRSALVGRKQTAEHIEKLSKSRKGKIPWPATRAAAISTSGKKQTKEHIEKRIAPRRGAEVKATQKKSIIIEGKEAWQCSMCKEWKVFDDWMKDKKKRNGIASKCRSCHAEYQRMRRRKGK